MSVFKRGTKWWYKFNWNGETVRESTKQSNKRTAEQMEAAHRTSLAKGEVGIRDRKPVLTLREFAENDFLPYARATFASKPNTLRYYECGVRSMTAFEKLAGTPLDSITTEAISGYVAARQERGLKVSSINRELQALRRMFHLAAEWGKVEKALPRVRMIAGEAHRDRVLTAAEEAGYLDAARAIGERTLEAYARSLEGIRATQRGETPIQPRDPFLLRDAATILLDCGLRPEECFRLRWENVREGAPEVQDGKTENARRRIPLSARTAAVLDMRRPDDAAGWIFPAPTRSGHIEPSSLKKQHAKACAESEVGAIPLYTFRHTCLTRWAPHMDPWTLAYLAGHKDMSITKRYVHPQEHNTRAAMERARSAQGGHNPRHSGAEPVAAESSTLAVIN